MNNKLKKGLLFALLLAGLGIGVHVGLFPADKAPVPPVNESVHAVLIETETKVEQQAEKPTDDKEAHSEVDKGYSRVLNDRGLELINQGKKEEAIPILERALDLNPDNKAAKENLAFARGETDAPAATKGGSKKGSVPMPDESIIPKNKPGSEIHTPAPTGAPAKSESPKLKPSAPTEKPKKVEAKSETDKEFAEVLIERGTTLIKAGELIEGNKLYEKATHLDPSNQTAVRGLQLVDDITGSATYRSSGIISEELLAQLLFEMTGMIETSKTPFSEIRDEEPEELEIFMSDEDCETEISSNKIAKDFYDGIELVNEIPTQFRVGEVLNISGVVTAKETPEKVMAFYSVQGEKNSKVALGGVEKKLFQVPLYFPTAGEFLLSVCPGTDCSAKAEKIIVTDSACDKSTGIVHERPLHFAHSVVDGLPAFSWTDEGNNAFRLLFSQGEKSHEFYLLNKTSFSPPLEAFSDFEAGEFTVKLWGASAGKNSLDLTSDWVASEKLIKLEAVDHISREENRITGIQITEEFETGKNIIFSGSAEEELSPQAVIIDPDENISKIPMTRDGKKFFGEVETKKSGVYFIEINRKDYLSLFVGGSVSKGLSPLLPDFFDLKTDEWTQGEAFDADKFSDDLLRLVNRERTERDLRQLEIDDKLNTLAEFRAKDMCERNYFAHVDPDGKDAGDHMEKFDIKTTIGENLAESMSVAEGHAGLMRSPAHRENIIKPTFSSVGFGFCSGRDVPDQLTIVQIFGEAE